MLASDIVESIVNAAAIVAGAFKRRRFVYLLGNGGSAADAQHIAAELQGRFKLDRPALPAVALTTNSSALTAIGNDLGYDQIFSRQVEGFVRPGDVVFAISTSGMSPNVLATVRLAKKRGATIIAMTGRKGGALRRLLGKSDVLIAAPSDGTARIQECHCLAGHTICHLVEEELFGRGC
jgi:D-sedoheptulose 7-phosphate isomerase